MPRLPDKAQKQFVSNDDKLQISVDMTRDAIFEYLLTKRKTNIIADLVFYAYRDFRYIELEPFLKAAIERSPVSIEGTKNKDIEQIANEIGNFENFSIYDEPYRLALPDEVWNFKRGDGIEKALLLANIIKSRDDASLVIIIDNGECALKTAKQTFIFKTSKQIEQSEWKF